jgi:DNA polymerase I
MKKQTIFLIDGSSFLYRAYYGIRPLHTESGEAVHAVYGFCRMIHKLIKKFDIKHLAIVWDSKGKTHRHEMFSDYKANRQAAPNDLFSQKDHIQEVAKLIDLAQINIPGLEADDILYSLAKDYSQDHDVVVVTSDKDLSQMLRDNITIYDSFKDRMIDQAACEEKYGFPIKKMPFYFALIGDASDNIPGVKGVGPKTAVKIVNQFDSLVELYENIDTLEASPRIKGLLTTNKDNAFLSKTLFTLQYNKQDLPLETIEFKESNWQHGLPLFQKLEFKQLIKDLNLKIEEQQSLFEDRMPLYELYDFRCVTTKEQLADLAETLKGVDEFALDTETKGLDPMQHPCVGISIAYKEGFSYYIPFGHETNEEQVSLAIVQKHLNPIFQDKKINKILHHAAFDYIALQQSGMILESISFDTLVAASLINKPWQKKGLKELSTHLFGEVMIAFSEVMKKYKAKTFANVPLQDATDYAAADAHQTLKLKYLFEKKLAEIKSEKIFYDIEMPLVPILAKMQIAGIYCQPSLLHELNIQVTSVIDKIVAEIFGLTQITINLNSPKQVAQLLFDNLNLPTGNKGRSTNVDVLTKLAKDHPVAGLILKYRELSKLKNTYLDALPASINPTTHRIHSSFNQALVATGRLSSSNPNLQNVPTSKSMDVRASFQATEDHVLVSADYSQIELRILAQLSQDPALLEAFKNDQDIHIQTAAFLFQLPESEISSEQRSVGKKINFSVLYGLTAYSLAGDLNIGFKEAKSYIESYFERYAQVKNWMNETVEKSKKAGYVETLHGRRRWIPGIQDNNRMVFEAAKRVAINTPVQGTAAEIMKIGMLKTLKRLKSEQVNATLLLQVHDEIIFSVHKDELDQTIKIIREELESVVGWAFPLKVSVQSGNSWSDLSK